jgi:prepilin-type N-terminal cleavage/methylation domain-containing protein
MARLWDTVKAPERAGFSLAEVIVATAILAIIASVVVSSRVVALSGDRERYQAVADSLSDLASAIGRSDPTTAQKSFKWVIRKYPAKLSQLTTPITTADRDICGTPYTAALTTRWLEPFWPTELRAEGVNLAKGFTAQDDLATFPNPNLGFRNGTTGAFQASPSGVGFRTDGAIAIRMPNVSLTDAQGLDAAVDGPIDGTAGTMLYPASDPTTVDYLILVSGC